MLGLLAVNAAFLARGTAGTYTPAGGGSSTPCIIVVDRSAEATADDDGRPRAGQVAIDVRASEVASPVKDGVFALGAESWRVQSKPKLFDGEGYVWTMTAVPTTP